MNGKDDAERKYCEPKSTVFQKARHRQLHLQNVITHAAPIRMNRLRERRSWRSRDGKAERPGSPRPTWRQLEASVVRKKRASRHGGRDRAFSLHHHAREEHMTSPGDFLRMPQQASVISERGAARSHFGEEKEATSHPRSRSQPRIRRKAPRILAANRLPYHRSGSLLRQPPAHARAPEPDQSIERVSEAPSPRSLSWTSARQSSSETRTRIRRP